MGREIVRLHMPAGNAMLILSQLESKDSNPGPLRAKVVAVAA